MSRIPCEGLPFDPHAMSAVDLLLTGIFENVRTHGLKYCPCRLRAKDWEEDLRIVCPCHFTIHETYKGVERGECWCGLFVRRK